MRAPLLACLALLGLLCQAAQGISDPRESALRLGLGSGDVGEPGDSICESRKHRKATLKLVKETPFVGLFRDLKNQSIFEASGMALLEGKYYVVFDSSFSLGYLDDRFSFRSHENKLIGDKDVGGTSNSQFEGIAYVPENGTFLLLQESRIHEAEYKPHIMTVRLKSDLSGYEILQTCVIEFALSEENKGFESIQYVVNSKGAWLLGLCEGNHCEGGEEGRESGEGRIVASKLTFEEDGECVWRPEGVIKIPRTANFLDYSAMAFNGNKLAILSQEDAAVWIGEFDKEELEFTSRGQVFFFPKDNHCEIVYCNLEGIQWIDDRRVVVTSDKAKANQPFYCDAKDQMVHIFALPATYDPDAALEESEGKKAEL